MPSSRALIALGIGIVLSASAAFAADWPTCPGVKISLIRGPNGGRVDWSRDGSTIAFDAREPDQKPGQWCWDVYQMKPDASDATCLTCGKSDLPVGTKGNPAYYPTGRYIVFQGERAVRTGLPLAPCNFLANPGVGLGSDLWVLDTTTGKSSLLYSPGEGLTGVLHPHFSPDGKMLLWSNFSMPGPGEKKKLESAGNGVNWENTLELADVAISPSGEMSLANIRQLFPTAASGTGMVESHGFTPDSKQVVFSGNMGFKDNLWTHSAIWMADISGRNLRIVTDLFYNEHGQISPSGKKIAWMSSAWSKSGYEPDGTEFFLMDMDGKNRCQLSHFNMPGYPESQGEDTTAADLSWSPDGKSLVAYSHDRNFNDASKFRENIYVIAFPEAQ